MKLKTKLVSILGTAAIATTSLSVVSACTFTRKPKGEYDKPTFHYAGETTLATEEGRNTLAISGFYANRDLYTGEEVTVEAINPTSNDKSEDVTASFSKDENGFVVNVTLTKIEAESTEEGSATFNLLFKTKYDNQTYEIPLENKTFTVNYIPKYVRNDITLFGATTVSTPKGNSEFTLQYQLNHELEANRTILTPETNNSKVHYRSMSREGQIITLTLWVDVPEAEKFSPDISEKFTVSFPISYYGSTQPRDTIAHEEVTVNYVPNWKPIYVYAVGKTEEDFIDLGSIKKDVDESGKVKLTANANFELSRSLETGEQLQITALTNDGNPLPHFDKWTYTMIGTSNYLSLSTTFEPQKVGEAYVSEAYSFQLVFTFTKEGEEPRVTTYPDVGFGWSPEWKNNNISDLEEEKTTPSYEFEADGTTSFSVPSNRFKLERNLDISKGDSLQVQVIQDQNVVQYSSYELVSTGGVSPEYYLKMYFNLNIPADEIQYPHTYPFKLQFSFKNNNVLMRSKTLPSKSGEIYKVNYKPSTNKLTFPNEVKNGQAGYTYFAFDAIFNEAPTYPSIENVTVTPDAGYAISPFNSTTTLDGKSKFEYKPAENKISFELCFVPTEEQKYTAQSFNISVSVKPTGVDPITGSTTLIYAPLEEDPEQEQEIESYIHDRSFSLMCYTEANGTYNVNYASAWIINQAHNGVLDKETNEINDDDPKQNYAYYVVTSYDTYKNFTKLYAQAAASEGNVKFGVGVADGTMQKEYSDYQGNKVKGLKFNTDYMMLDAYNAFSFETDCSNYLWSNNVEDPYYSSLTGTSNIVVGRINFAYVDGATEADLPSGSKMNIHMKNKLGKINGWAEEGTPIVNFKEDSEGKDTSSGYYVWNSDQIFQGGFPTISYNISSQKTDTLARWDEGWWTNEGKTTFTTQYYSADETYYYGLYDSKYLDKDISLYHYSPTYYIKNINTSSLPRLSPGSMIAYRESDNKIYVFGIFGGRIGRSNGCFDILSEEWSDGNAHNILDYYINQ